MWNELAAALMDDFGALDPARRNLARRAFVASSEDRGGTLMGISDAAEFRHHAVMQLRRANARYPTDAGVTGLVDELRSESREFARLWDLHDVQPAAMLTKTFRHRVVGDVTVDCDSLVLDDRDQHLVLYTAPADSAAAEAFSLLSALGASAVHAWSHLV